MFFIDGDLPRTHIRFFGDDAVAPFSASEKLASDAEIIEEQPDLIETQRHTESVFHALHGKRGSFFSVLKKDETCVEILRHIAIPIPKDAECYDCSSRERARTAFTGFI